MGRWVFMALMVLVSANIAGIEAAGQSQPRPQNGVAENTALVKDVYGAAQQRKDGKGDWKNLNINDRLTPQTTIKTRENAAVLLLLWNKHVLRVGEKTTVELRELGKDNAFSFNVVAGNVWSLVRKASKPTKYEVETPSAVAGVSGTVFGVFHDPASAETTVSADEGQVNVRQGFGGTAVPVSKGLFLKMRRAGALQSPRPGGNPLPPDSAPPADPIAPTASLIKPMAQPPEQVKMWRIMRRQEHWMQQAGGDTELKLNRQIEPQLRPMVFYTQKRPLPRAVLPPGAGPLKNAVPRHRLHP